MVKGELDGTVRYVSKREIKWLEKADNVIYDMELFKLTKIPHKRLYAVKIVSDNLNEKDCENFDETIAWATAREIVRKIIKREKKWK